MTIKYIPEGDKFRANQLWGEGRHQLSILKNAMSFQKLKQDQRLVSFADGTIIKCLSCFGQDVINIFVPQVFIGGAPEYREREESTYYPAIEVYDSSYLTTYVGVVICKGGGFEPPYEFISKDSLPADTHTEPLGKLPKERIWETEDGREFQDIEPKGIAGIELATENDPAPTITAPGEYKDLITRAEREWVYVNGIWCWSYWATTEPRHEYNRTESMRHDYIFSYSLPEDIDPGDWPDYYYEGGWQSGGKKPTRALSLSGDTLYYDVQGSGNNNFWWEVAPFAHNVQEYAMKYVGGWPWGHWERDDVNVNFISITQDAIAQLESYYPTYGDPADATFPGFSDGSIRGRFLLHEYFYSYRKDLRWIWAEFGSVLDGNHHALAYSMKNHKEYIDYSRSIDDLSQCLSMAGYPTADECLEEARVEDIIIDERTEGPLCVVIDGTIFEVAAESSLATSPRLQWCNLRYFRLGNRSIGLFKIDKNYYDPTDYLFVYAEAETTDIGSEAKDLVITAVVPDDEATLDDAPQLVGGNTVRFSVKTNSSELTYMKDSEGNTLYGKRGVRLIKETTAIKEMATAEQPGLFRKII